MSAHADDMQKHVKQYMAVFGTLAFLTVVTVAVSYVHLSIGKAVVVALAVATLKASLVAAIFMHLNHEVKLIHQVLALTFVFFLVLMSIPISWYSNELRAEQSIWSQPIPASRANQGGDHGDGHH